MNFLIFDILMFQTKLQAPVEKLTTRLTGFKKFQEWANHHVEQHFWEKVCEGSTFSFPAFNFCFLSSSSIAILLAYFDQFDLFTTSLSNNGETGDDNKLEPNNPHRNELQTNRKRGSY